MRWTQYAFRFTAFFLIAVFARGAYARGTDPQLDKAIELLLDALKKSPVPRPAQPADPVRARAANGVQKPAAR